MLAQPTVTSVTPGSGTPLVNAITVIGTGFNTTLSNNQVRFGGDTAVITSGSATSLSMLVPVGAQYTNVSVLNRATRLIAASSQQFTPTFINSCFVPGATNFKPGLTIPAVNGPYNAAVGDVDGDGKLDMVSVNFNTNNISTFRNTGLPGAGGLSAASFAAASSFAITGSTNPQSIKLADLDGDGRLDFIVSTVGSGGRLSVFKNTSVPGTIGYSTIRTFTTGFGGLAGKASESAFGDFDGDGKLDIAVAVYALNASASPSGLDSVKIFRNNITSIAPAFTGTCLTGPISFSNGFFSTPVSIFAVDFDGDGKTDLVTANQYNYGFNGQGSICVYRNTTPFTPVPSPITFAAPVEFPVATGLQCNQVIAADINGDGKPDIVVSTSDILSSTPGSVAAIAVFQNNCSSGVINSSSFGPRVDFPVGTAASSPVGVSASDLDGDGKVDIIAGCFNDMTVNIFRNTSGGTINSSSLTASGSYPTGVAGEQTLGVNIGDMDGDTKPDLIAVNKLGNGGTGALVLFRNYPIPVSDTISGNTHLCVPTVDAFSNTIGGGIWSVTNTTLATINSVTGAVHPLAVGTDTVVYTIICNGDTAIVTKSFSVNALPSVAPITGGSGFNLCSGYTMSLSDATPSGTWSSTLSGVANVVGGLVTGGSVGNATISYALTNSCGTVASTYGPITVLSSPAPITGNFAICIGDITTLHETTNGGTWSTSASPAVATISSAGTTALVGGVSSGTAMISYSLGSCYDTAIVTIGAIPAVNPITGTVTTLCSGNNASLSETSTGGSWSSSNNAFATVSSSGMVHAISAGNVYITYTITGACGSNYQVYGPITVNTSPAAITGTMSVCVGGHTTLSNITSPGTWSSATNTAATITAGGVVGGASAGNEVISYTMTGGCYSLATITVNPFPVVAAIVGATSVCTGAQVTLTDATSSGTWSSSNSSIASVTSGGVVGGGTPGNVNITYSKTNGCGTTTQTLAMTVNANPAAITGTFTVCQGNIVTLNNTVSGGTWSSFPATVGTVSSGGGVGGASGGTVTISYTTTGGCFDTALVTVNAAPLPISGGNSVCVGSTLSLTDASGSGTWSTSAPGFATISPAGLVTGLATGSANINYTFTSTTGCSTTLPIFVNPLPNAIGGPANVCLGSSITLTETTPLGTWSTSAPATATIVSSSGYVTGLAIGTSVISYTVTSTGCSRGIVVTVNSLPGVISGPSSVCLGTFVTMTDTPSGGTWFSTNSLSAPISPSGIVTGAILGVTTISYTIPSTNCYATKSVTVNAPPLPITGSDTICAGTDITLSDPTPGGVWSTGTPGIATIINSTSGDFRGVSGGFALISYTVSSTGCYDTALIPVLPAPAPITGPLYACVGFTVPLSSDSTGGKWYSSDTSMAKIDSLTGVATGRAPGVVIITYSAGIFGCSAYRSLTVNPIVVPDIQITTSPSTTICAGTPVTFTANTINPGTAPAFEWRKNNTVVGGGPTFSSSTLANHDTIVVKMTSNAVCPVPAIVRDTVVMTVNPLLTPIIHLTTGSLMDTVCQGVPVTINPNPINAGAAPTFAWKINFIPVGPGSTFTYVPANGDIITVVVHSNATCILVDTAVDTMHLTVSPFVTPTVTMIGSDTTCSGYPTVFYTSQTNGGWNPTYSWSVTSGATGTGSSIAFSGVTGDVVQVTMTSSFPCLLTPTATSTPHTIDILPVFLPAVTVTVNPGYIVVPGTPVTFTAHPVNPGSFPSYRWKRNGYVIPGATTATYTTSTMTNGDNFSCYLTNNDFCNGITVYDGTTMYVGANVGINDPGTANSNVSIIPNPNKGSFNITGTLGVSTNEEVSITVTNMLGQVVYRNTANAGNGAIDEQVILGNNLANGMYLLNIHSEHFSKVIHFELGK